MDKFFRLDYGHEELEALLDKLNAGKLLTPDEYSYLIEVIGGVQNISTFDGDYNNLENKPHIPERVDQLQDHKDYVLKEELTTIDLYTLQCTKNYTSYWTADFEKKVKNYIEKIK